MAAQEMKDTKALGILERIESDLADDRSRIDNLLHAIEGLTSEVRILKERLPRTETKFKDVTVDAMQQVTQPVIDATEDLTKAIEKAQKTSMLQKLFPKKK